MKSAKQRLDVLQSEVYQEILKPKGFKKQGRTFNNKNEDGLVEVINFQMSR